LSTLGKVAHHTFHTQAGVAQALAVLAAELGSRIPGTSAQATARSTSAQAAAAALTPPPPTTTLAQPSPLVLIDADDCQLSPAQDVTSSALDSNAGNKSLFESLVCGSGLPCVALVQASASKKCKNKFPVHQTHYV